MNAQELLASLEDRGIVCGVDEHGFYAKPSHLLSENDRSALTQLKGELIQILSVGSLSAPSASESNIEEPLASPRHKTASPEVKTKLEKPSLRPYGELVQAAEKGHLPRAAKGLTLHIGGRQPTMVRQPTATVLASADTIRRIVKETSGRPIQREEWECLSQHIAVLKQINQWWRATQGSG